MAESYDIHDLAADISDFKFEGFEHQSEIRHHAILVVVINEDKKSAPFNICVISLNSNGSISQHQYLMSI